MSLLDLRSIKHTDLMRLKKFPALDKYLKMSKYPYIVMANKKALRVLWDDVWHTVGKEWPKNRLPGNKFKNGVFHADSSSLETICKVAEDCGVKLIKRLEEGEIELMAPGAEDYSVVISQDHYDDSLNNDYTYLDGLSITEAIGILKGKFNEKSVSFDYIYLHFKKSSDFTGLRTKILAHSPESHEFREFLLAAKSKLEATANILYNAVDRSEEPMRSNAQAEREAISLNINERYAMMKKRHAFLNAMVSPFNSFDEFMIDKGEWCAIVGIDIVKRVNYLEITINLDDSDYETYFAISSSDGHLVVSEIIGWQDDFCANSFLNIFTCKRADEDEILAYKN